MGLSSTFPHSKIKSHVLRDEDVGRLSFKAVELIAACSALFVSDLVRAHHDEDNAEAREKLRKSRKRMSPSSLASSSTGVKNARKHGFDSDDAAGPIDLARIQSQIKKSGYEFLDGVLDDLTEKNAPKYDVVLRKRERQKKNVKSKAAACATSHSKHLPSGVLEGSKHYHDTACDECALRDAIEDAQFAPICGVKEIIEDDDDYD